MSKARFHTQVEKGLDERVRAAVVGMQRIKGQAYTLTQFTSDALRIHVEAIEAEFNGGAQWEREASPSPLPRGRRL